MAFYLKQEHTCLLDREKRVCECLRRLSKSGEKLFKKKCSVLAVELSLSIRAHLSEMLDGIETPL